MSPHTARYIILYQNPVYLYSTGFFLWNYDVNYNDATENYNYDYEEGNTRK